MAAETHASSGAGALDATVQITENKQAEPASPENEEGE